MEIILVYLLSICVAFYIGLVTIKRRRDSKFPPGSAGFPVIGETLHLISSGPEKFIRRRMEKHSRQIFTTSLLGQKVAVVCGPQGNKFMLNSPNDRLTPWAPPSLSKFRDWVDPRARGATEHRRFVHEIMRNGNAVRGHIPVMDSMLQQHINTHWEPFEEIKVYPRVKRFMLSLACKLFLGLEDPIQVQWFSDSFSKAMSAIYAIPVDVPGTPYRRAVKEIENLKKKMLTIIQERRNSLTTTGTVTSAGNLDVLSRMLLDEKTKSRPGLEMALNLVGILIPSYETTSGAVTFVLKYVAELPDIHDKLYKEIMEIAKSKAPEELLNWEDIQKMHYSWHVICESQRLTPPGLGTFREVLTDLNYAGYTIPKGWKMLWSPFTTNKDPEYFPDPETFDPTRHEGNGPTPGTHLPFSMGLRACPGQEYAKFIILVYMYKVVKRFKLQKLMPDEKIFYRGGPVPADGLPMRLNSQI